MRITVTVWNFNEINQRHCPCPPVQKSLMCDLMKIFGRIFMDMIDKFLKLLLRTTTATQ